MSTPHLFHALPQEAPPSEIVPVMDLVSPEVLTHALDHTSHDVLLHRLGVVRSSSAPSFVSQKPQASAVTAFVLGLMTVMFEWSMSPFAPFVQSAKKLLLAILVVAMFSAGVGYAWMLWVDQTWVFMAVVTILMMSGTGMLVKLTEGVFWGIVRCCRWVTQKGYENM